MDFCKVDVNYGTPVLDLMSISSKVPLLKRKTKVQFFGEKHEINCKAMLDGGAVCSFVQSTVLAKETRIKVNNFLNNDSDENPLALKAELVTIKGATGEVTERCAVANVKLTIGQWVGYQMLIITTKLGDKEIILGRDFLKSNHVSIDHGTDRSLIIMLLKLMLSR